MIDAEEAFVGRTKHGLASDGIRNCMHAMTAVDSFLVGSHQNMKTCVKDSETAYNWEDDAIIFLGLNGALAWLRVTCTVSLR